MPHPRPNLLALLYLPQVEQSIQSPFNTYHTTSNNWQCALTPCVIVNHQAQIPRQGGSWDQQLEFNQQRYDVNSMKCIGMGSPPDDQTLYSNNNTVRTADGTGTDKGLSRAARIDCHYRIPELYQAIKIP